MFYVLEGSLTVHLDHQTHVAGPGPFVCVPPGVVHGFANETSEPVRFLNINTPAGWEGCMRDLADASEADGALTPGRIGEIAARYDFVLAEERPPPSP